MPRDVGAARVPQVKKCLNPHNCFGMRKIPLYQSPNILGKGDAEIAGAPTGTLLKLIFKGDLSTSHHDGYIIAHIPDQQSSTEKAFPRGTYPPMNFVPQSSSAPPSRMR